MRRALAIAVGLLAVLTVPVVLTGCRGEPEPLEEPFPAPDFDLAVMDGEGTVSLSELRGKTVILDFWATWCPPCEYQVPELNAFHEAHREDSDVAVFGISVDTEGEEVVAAWAAEKGVRYPILLAEGDQVARRYGAVGFPTLIVVNAEGQVDLTHVGVIDRAILEDTLKRLRKGAG